MSSRVVWLPEGSPASASAEQHLVGDHLGRWSVVAAADDSALVLLSMDRGARVLYFSDGEYGREIEGLSQTEIEDAVELRRRNFDPLEEVMNLLWLRQRAALSWAALDGRGPARDYFDGALDRIAWLGWQGRLVGPAKVWLRAMVERDAALAVDLEAEGEMEEAAQHRAWCRALAEALAREGFTPFAQALPSIAPQRVALIADSEAVRAALRANSQPFVPWKGRLVVVQSLSSIVTGGERVLWGAPHSLGALGTLTQAQQERAIDARVQWVERDPRSPGRELLNEARVEMTTMRIFAQTLADEALAAELSRPRKPESDRLFETLARDPLDVTGDRQDPLGRLRGEHESLVRDAIFARQLGELEGETEVASRAALAVEMLAQEGTP
jgi:hypothetical protein